MRAVPAYMYRRPLGRRSQHFLSCINWLVGRYKSNADSAVYACAMCSRGKFQNMTGKTQCEPCGAGWFRHSPTRLSLLCDLVPPQSIFFPSSLTACLTAFPGRYRLTTGNVECTVCAPNSFKATANSAECGPCPYGQYSAPGATSCLECDITKDPTTGVDMSSVHSVARCTACTGQLPGDCTAAVCETAEVCLGGEITTEGCTGVPTVFGRESFNPVSTKCSANCSGAYGFRAQDQPYCLGQVTVRPCHLTPTPRHAPAGSLVRLRITPCRAAVRYATPLSHHATLRNATPRQKVLPARYARTLLC